MCIGGTDGRGGGWNAVSLTDWCGGGTLFGERPQAKKGKVITDGIFGVEFPKTGCDFLYGLAVILLACEQAELSACVARVHI